MKMLRIALFLFAAVAAGQAAAQSCSGGTQVKNTGQANTLGTLLAGKTVCASLGSEQWHEYHGAGAGGGALIDYKQGPNSKSDPSTQVGTWAVSGTGAGTQVTYNYGGGGTFSYTVHEVGGKYNFCGPRVIANARLVNGNSGCGQ